MRSCLAWLLRERLTDVALALALGTALASLAEELVGIPVAVLAQNVGRNPFADGDVLDQLELLSGAPYYLNVSIGGTVVAYGHVVAATASLGLIAGLTALVLRQRDRELRPCSHCAALTPREARHCAYCGSAIESEGK